MSRRRSGVSAALRRRLAGPQPGPRRRQGPPARQPKTFVLGLGCQKGGTTWLYDYLVRSPQFAEGPLKEYHVFDAIDSDAEPWVQTRVQDLADRALAKMRDGRGGNPGHLLRAGMCADPQSYFDHFTGLLHRRPQIRATADITPSYGSLSQARLANIKRRFARRGIRTMALFTMRDPVERIYSQMRMREQRNAWTVGALDVLAQDYASPIYERRTRYDVTLERIDATFPTGEAWFGFYETLFNEASLRDLCEHVGIAFHEPEYDRKVNVSAAPVPLPDSLVREIATHYSEVYEAVSGRFPGVDLERIWPSSRFVG